MSSGVGRLSPVSSLMLARLWVAGERGATATELRKALDPLVGHHWTGTTLSEQLGVILAELGAQGLADLSRKGKTERGTITSTGRRKLLETLGVTELPSKITWDKLKKTYLAANALGLPTPTGPLATRFGGDPGFKGALLSRLFELPGDPFPVLQEALDAFAWRSLGFEPGPKFTIKAVQAALILRELGQVERITPKHDPKKEVGKLLAREVGARQAGKDELRLAAIRRWVDSSVRGASAEAESESKEHQGLAAPDASKQAERPAAAPFDLSHFAQRVIAAARRSSSGRFGPDKVFIHHVWQSLRDEPGFESWTEEDFQRRLAEANQARYLDLTRADMVEAMNADDVSRSELNHLGARFHFVIVN